MISFFFIWKTGGTKSFPLSPIVATMVGCYTVGTLATVLSHEVGDKAEDVPVRASTVGGLLGALFALQFFASVLIDSSHIQATKHQIATTS